MRPVTVVFYDILQSGVRVLRGAYSAGQGRGSAIQTGFQGLHRPPQLLQIGKAGVQLFPGGGAVYICGEIQRLQLRDGAADAGKAPAGFPAGASACRKSRFAPRGAARISRAAVSVGTEPLTRPADGSAS